jgi:hypothetical protein
MQPTSRLLYLVKRFTPSLLDLVHRVRIRQQDAPTPPRTPEEGLQKSAA